MGHLEWKKHLSKWRQRQGVQAAFWVPEETGPAEVKDFIGQLYLRLES